MLKFSRDDERGRSRGAHHAAGRLGSEETIAFMEILRRQQGGPSSVSILSSHPGPASVRIVCERSWAAPPAAAATAISSTSALASLACLPLDAQALTARRRVDLGRAPLRTSAAPVSS
jgi:hypothetical protein